jgi:hypothetical protein
VVREPQEIEDEEHEQVVGRVAAIDVAKATGMVCTRVPNDKRPGRRLTKVWEVSATTNAIIELADHLVCQSIERVVVESTSDYWRPFFYLLEARGLQVWLVNAREVKHLPGRPKTDRLDSVWLAKLTERGMLRPSFVPPSEIRRLRDYSRLRLDLRGAFRTQQGFELQVRQVQYREAMSMVCFRRHQFSTLTDNEGGSWVDPDMKSDTPVEVDVDLPSLINANALVASAKGPTGFWARHHELRLILCLLTDQGPSQMLRLLGPQFKASSGHIRRLVSESVGLGLLTGTASELYEWRPSQTIVANFDVLPTNLRGYKTNGVRPDLLYAQPDGYIAGEARGRSTKASASPPSTPQLKRLNDLLTWSNAFNQHPFFMSWSHITADRTVVDFFDYRLDEGPHDDPRHHHWSVPEATEQGRPTMVRYSREETLEEEFMEYELPLDSEESAEPRRARSTRRQADSFPPGPLARLIRERLTTGEQLLFDTAPPLDTGRDRLLDRQIRGAWGHLDLLGPTGYYFFLGVLDRGFTEFEAAELSRPQERGRPVEAGVSGRLVAAVTRTASGSPPSLSTLEEALTTLA